MLIELEEKRLQWFCIMKMIDRVRMPRRALELEFKGKRLMGQSRSRRLSLVLEDIKSKRKEQK